MNIREQVSLKPYNTLGFEVSARYFVYADRLETLHEAIQYAREKALPLLLLGGGSNVVLAQNFAGLAIVLGLKGRKLCSQSDGDICLLSASAGENWHELVTWSLQQHAYGLENLSLIPGNIGAAPIQNIGAYGVELVDVFHELQALHIHTGEIQRFNADDCRFAYRDSVFKGELKDQYIITDVTLKLSQKPNLQLDYGPLRGALEQSGLPITPQSVSTAVCTIRSSKLPDPEKLGNAGSFFKNPLVGEDQAKRLLVENPCMPAYPQPTGGVKLAAGWLVEQAGFKGCSFKGVGVHDQQALVLVNRAGGTGTQLLDLAQQIQSKVADLFEVVLEIEPRIY